ncbi:MAG: EAL domain-containing protein [Burkholderiaceae bacterium]
MTSEATIEARANGDPGAPMPDASAPARPASPPVVLARHAGQSPPSASSSTNPFAVMKHAQLMIVDDEPTTIEVVQTYLEEAGYSDFIRTSNPLEALPLMTATPPDLLLLDLMMPEMDGFEVLKQVRNHESLRYTPIIVLTAAADPDTKLKALELGATDFLAKPVDASELTLRVRNALAFKAYQDRLARQDALTGLPNRGAFLESVERTLRKAIEDRRTFALISIDLDRFKQVNDSFGHKVGDRLLLDAATRIRTILDEVLAGSVKRSEAMVARAGGDEFMALIPEARGANASGNFIRRLIESFQDAFPLGDHEIFVTPSIGVAILPVDGEDAETLVRNAETAMQQAKRRGRNTFEFYSKEMNSRAYERMSTENHLRKALEREEFVLFFQPKVHVSSLKVIGAEVLLRWNHPEKGLVLPHHFIPVAEETGLIGEIGSWVLEQACRQGVAWRDAGLPPLSLSVNMSVAQFTRRLALPGVRHALAKSGFAAEHLVLELTESVLMDNPDDGEKTLRELKSLGVSLSIDDFGTGYSSLTYLQRFPIDEIKIDKSFVGGVATQKDSRAIVSAIIALGQAMGLRVVAEGVETSEQLAFLRKRRCDQFQGFLYGKPMPAKAYRIFIQRVLARDRG